jgi:N-methylhydantoinase B
VLRHGLEEIADEMNVALMRAAYSTNITDRRDCSCALFNAQGEAVAQSQSGTPLHLGVMPAVLRNVLRRIPASEMQPGDQYMTNTPYPEGPGHLNDVTLVRPVFVGGELVALVANQAHQIDVGGMVPGSMPADAVEIFQEGMQIPPMALLRAGEVVEDTLSLFLANVRTPDVTRGDLLAQAAANNVGAERAAAVFERWGCERTTTAMARLLDQAEDRVRVIVQRVPDGEYAAEDVIGGDADRVVLRVVVRVSGDTLVADFTGTDAQVAAPINCRPATVQACLAYVVQGMFDPDILPNAGTLRRLHVVAPEGTVVNARFPASLVHSNIVTSARICDVLIRALYQAVPERAIAACAGTQSLICMGGYHNGEPFTYIETHGGGSGAHAGHDGQSAVHTHMTNTLNSPVEVLEQEFPFRITEYAVERGSGGAGRWQGGCGLRKTFAIDAPMTVTTALDRVATRPWGLEGGGDAQPGRIELRRAGSVTLLAARGTHHLVAGDLLTVVTPGGGGWGAADGGMEGDRA